MHILKVQDLPWNAGRGRILCLVECDPGETLIPYGQVKHNGLEAESLLLKALNGESHLTSVASNIFLVAHLIFREERKRATRWLARPAAIRA